MQTTNEFGIVKLQYLDIPPVPKQSARFASAEQPQASSGALPSRMSAGDYQRMIKGGSVPQSGGGKVISYRDGKVERFCNAIAFMTRQQLPKNWEPYHETLIFIDIVFMFKVPKSKGFDKHRKAIDMGIKIYKTTKPDCDNLVKAYLDAVEGIIYTNDATVAKQTIEKVYGNRDAIFVSFTFCG